MKEKGEALKEKDRLLANAIEGMRGKGMDAGAIASSLGLSEAAMDRYMVGSINSHRKSILKLWVSFCHLFVSIWRKLSVLSVTMPASLPQKLTLCTQR